MARGSSGMRAWCGSTAHAAHTCCTCPAAFCQRSTPGRHSQEQPLAAGGRRVTVSGPPGVALANRMVGAPGQLGAGGGGLGLRKKSQGVTAG